MVNTWRKFWLRAGYLHCLKISPHKLLICCKQKIVIMQKKTCTIPWPNDRKDIMRLPTGFLENNNVTSVRLWLEMYSLNGIMRNCQTNTNGEHVITKRRERLYVVKNVKESWEAVPYCRRPKKYNPIKDIIGQLIKLE